MSDLKGQGEQLPFMTLLEIIFILFNDAQTIKRRLMVLSQLTTSFIEQFLRR